MKDGYYWISFTDDDEIFIGLYDARSKSFSLTGDTWDYDENLFDIVSENNIEYKNINIM